MGNFDKRASAAEIEEASRSLPGIIVAALAPRLKSALDQQDEARSAEILSLLNASGSSTEAAGVVDDLLGSLEDTLDTHCRRMEADLRERLATNHDSPHTFYVRNREASEDAEAFYKASIAPVLEKIRAIAANRLGVIARAQGQCSQALTLLALGWEWTARFMQAEKALQAALELADGLAARSKIQRELDRMRPLAEQQRQWKNPLVPPKPKARPAQASGAGGSRAWVFVAIALVSGVARLITQSTTPTSPTPSVPLYDSQSINSIIKSIPVPSNGSGERPPDFVTLPHGETTLMGETNREP